MKKKVHLAFWIIPVVILLLSIACCRSDIPDDSELVLASWNVQNLFDAIDDGTEEGYSQFTGKGLWTEELYRKRLEKTVQVFSLGKLKTADIIVLCEVENDNVVKDILNTREMKNKGFSYYVFAKEDQDAIGNAIISRLPVLDAKVHHSPTRPIIEARIAFQKSFVTVLAVHAKSRLEGKEKTDSIRRETGEILDEISSSVFRDNPNEMIIIAGDFNDNWYDDVMMSSHFDLAPLAVTADSKSGFWYCFWMDDSKSIWPTGSYYWSEESKWESFDNILVKENSGTLSVKDAGVIFEGMLKSIDNKPNSYVRNLGSGVSDHLPVWVSVF